MSLTISLIIPTTANATMKYHKDFTTSVLKIGIISNGSVIITQITCGAIKNTQRKTTDKIIPTIESPFEIFSLYFLRVDFNTLMIEDCKNNCNESKCCKQNRWNAKK